MKVILAGGGTGGHLFPALAVAENIKEKYPDAEIIFVGTELGIEKRVVPQYGYELKFISSRGFVGKSIKEKMVSIIKLIQSCKESDKILKSFLPDIVIGVGGYASFPLVLAASLKKFPTLILEQNTVPGLANKILGKFVSAIAITYPETIDYFPGKKVYLTGTPIRKSIFYADRNKAFELFNLDVDKITVLVFGGSLGARKINKAVTESLPYLFEIKEKIQFIHQTGDADYNWVSDEYKRLNFKGRVLPFIYEMAEAYSVADIIVSRAGASTVAEITALGKASILIPYPFAAYNHQELNARRLQSRGACEMILDRELNGELLAKKIKKIILEPNLKKEMELAMTAFGKPNAAEKIIEIAESLIKNR